MKPIRSRITLLLLIFLCCTQQRSLTFIIGGTPNDFIFWEQVIEDFKRQTKIEITLIRSATQTELRKQQIFIALRGHKPDPDIIVMDIAWIGQLAASGWLEPLDGYAIDTTPFFNNIVTLADVYNRQIIGLPLYVDAGVLLYRDDLLRKYGFHTPPKTWDELLAMSVRIQKSERRSNPDFWGFVWQGAQYEGLVCNALEYFCSAGGGFYKDSGSLKIDSDENIYALQFMTNLIHKEKISPPNTYSDMKEEETRLIFHNGNALFQRNWPYAAKLHSGEGSAVKGLFGMTALPCFGGKKSCSTLGGWHIGISKYSDRKQDAAAFINHVTSFEVQKKLALMLGHNPARKDVYETQDLQSEYIVALKNILLFAVPRPVVPYYSQISLVLQKHINSAVAGNQSPGPALKQAQAEIEDIIAAYGK